MTSPGFAIISYRCIVTINVMCLFLTVPWVGLQCVIVVFPDHTHVLFDTKRRDPGISVISIQ